MKKFFRKLIFVVVAVAASAFQASALGLGVFDHLGAGVSVGTNGIGVEATTTLTRFLNVRAGVSFLPGISFNTDVDGTYHDATYGDHDFTMDIDASLKRTQGSLIFNVYPIPVGSFFVAAGAYFGGSTVVDLKGHSSELANLASGSANLEIGDYLLPVDKNGNVSGQLKTNGFRPYLGLGWGRAVPNHRVNFNIELGVQFMGKLKIYTDGQELSKLLTDNDDDWQKVMDKLVVYPVLKFTINGRIF